MLHLSKGCWQGSRVYQRDLLWGQETGLHSNLANLAKKKKRKKKKNVKEMLHITTKIKEIKFRDGVEAHHWRSGLEHNHILVTIDLLFKKVHKLVRKTAKYPKLKRCIAN